MGVSVPYSLSRMLYRWDLSVVLILGVTVVLAASDFSPDGFGQLGLINFREEGMSFDNCQEWTEVVGVDEVHDRRLLSH